MTVGLRYSTLDLIGFISTIILFLILPFTHYKFLSNIKILVVLIITFIIFASKLNLINKQYFNKYVTYLVMLNIIGLIFIKNPLFINILLIIITITTPTFKITDNDNDIQMENRFINKTLWIILMTNVLLYIYLYNKTNFNCIKCTSHKIINGLVIFALLIPFILYFIDGKWIEYRAICLNLLIICDIFLNIFKHNL